MKVCQYGEECYRKNPMHFREFSHPHLERIYEAGRDATTNEYVIPDELFMSAEVIGIQLSLLENLFPKTTAHKCAAATAPRAAKSCDVDSVASTSTSVFNETSGYRLGNKGESTVSVTEELPLSNKQVKAPTPSTSGRCDSETSRLAKKKKITRNIRDYIPVVVEKGLMAEKLKLAAPYNFFLTAITDSKFTHQEPLSITLQEILDKSLGEIESSVQINFMVDIGWLLGHYYFAEIMNTPLLVLYGDEMPELRTISSHQPQVTAVHVKMPAFSTSHAKMMLLGYRDGSMRVVISTANLYEDDWHNRTQGVWLSPKLPPMRQDADTAAGDSHTEFRQDLMLYLVEYNIPQLQPWIARIRKSDFSAINVFFIGSVPGGHREGGRRGYSWGHPRLANLLQKHAAGIDDKIPIVCQSSSIGSLGANVESWIQHDFLNSLRKNSQTSGLCQFPPFRMIYPSFGNVSNSHDALLGGGCLPYSKNTNDKQPWLRSYLHQWSSRTRSRSQAMPHIKSYTRFNISKQSLYWFVLTSANLSKAAWGSFNKNVKLQPCLRISNFEAGVLFLPRFVIGKDTFPLGDVRDGIPPFPMPYDVPLLAYGPDDKPFLMDYLSGI